MRPMFVLGLLLAAPALAQAPLYKGESTVGISGERSGPEVSVANVQHEVTRQVVTPRGKLEQLIVTIESRYRETIGEPGIFGEVRLTARPIDGAGPTPPLYDIRLKNRGAHLDDHGFIVVELDDGSTRPIRSYHAAATGERLFETAAGLAAVALPGPYQRLRFAAFMPVLDDRQDLLAPSPRMIGVLTYASRSRVIRQVAVEAETRERAAELRSIWDEDHALAWSAEGPPVLTLRFNPSGIRISLAVEDDDLKAGLAPAGIALRPLPNQPLLGGWRIAEASPAPWAATATPADLKGRFLLFGPGYVRSGGSVLDCRKAEFAEARVPAEGLFMGAGLTAAQAKGLGFATALTPSVTLTCDSGVFTFHRAADDRWLFALDNVIHALERTVD